MQEVASQAAGRAKELGANLVLAEEERVVALGQEASNYQQLLTKVI